MHLSPDAQVEVKRDVAVESLERAGMRDFSRDVSGGAHTAAASPEAGYRTRLRFHVSRRKDAISMGFRRRSSHHVVDIERCYLASDSLNESWARVRDWVRCDPARSRGLTSIELQESSDEMGRIVGRFFVGSRDGIRRFERHGPAELLQEDTLDGVVAEAEQGGQGDEGRSLRLGAPVVRHRVGALSLRQSAGSFFQANRFLLEPLVRAASPTSRVRRLVDLYSGVGLFSLALSDRAESVVGVEGSPRAVVDAKANACNSRAEHVRFVRADVARFAQDHRFERGDYVVVDPPRGGLPSSLAEALAGSPIDAFCYVSCDAPALGRDAAWFVARGFRIETLQVLDLFPNTHHFETVVRWSR